MRRPVFQAVITLLGAGLFIWGAIGPAHARTLYSDDGISELNVPEYWEVSPHLSRSAVLRAFDPQSGTALIVNTYLPDDINPMALAKQAEDLSHALLDGLENGQLSAARQLTIQGQPAIEYEVTGLLNGMPQRHLSTVVEGRTAKHHLIVWPWSVDDPAVREAQRKLVASFRESTKQRQVRERIGLAFNWPGKADSTFEFHGKKTRQGKTNAIRMNGITRVRSLGENQLLVNTQVTDYKVQSGDRDDAKRKLMQQVMQQALNGIPDYVVDTNGNFVGIENIDNYRERLERILLKALPEDAGAIRQKLKPLLQSLVSETALTQAIHDGWNDQVANWTGGSYALRERYVFAGQYRSAVLGEAAFPMTLAQRLLGRVPCNGRDKAMHCVMLEQVSRVTDPAFGKAMHAFVNKTIKDVAGDKAGEMNSTIERAEFVKTVTLVVDPETLLPYVSNTNKITTVVVSNRGRTETTQEMEESSTRYTY